MMEKQKTILITGAAGYIGAMLVDQFSRHADVVTIVAVDMKPMPEMLRDNPKIVWITGELSSGVWEGLARRYNPEVVIHCAWQIKELYGKKDFQRRLNIEASRRVFNFAFSEASVEKLVHFSTVASYGAHFENNLERRFTEDDALAESEYLYGVEKKEAEDVLKTKYEESDKSRQVFVIRPASVTGPRGRYGAGKKGLLHILENVLPVVPVAGKSWCRQYAHEDDLTDLVALLTFNETNGGRGYDVLNASPEDIVLAKDMARVFGKRTFPVHRTLVRVTFAMAWHLTRGVVPTGRGGWKFFSFPLVVTGKKATEKYGFKYAYTSFEALSQNRGRYQNQKNG